MALLLLQFSVMFVVWCGWSVIGSTIKWNSAVDYRRTFEEIISRDVGSNSPRSPRVQSHRVIARRPNNVNKMSVDKRTWLCWGQTVTQFGHFLSLKGHYCKWTGMAVGEEIQLPRLTDKWIRNKLLSVTAVWVHPRATTHTDYGAAVKNQQPHKSPLDSALSTLGSTDLTVH